MSTNAPPNTCRSCEDCRVPGALFPASPEGNTAYAWIERCDACSRFRSDEDAANAVVAALGARRQGAARVRLRRHPESGFAITIDGMSREDAVAWGSTRAREVTVEVRLSYVVTLGLDEGQALPEGDDMKQTLAGLVADQADHDLVDHVDTWATVEVREDGRTMLPTSPEARAEALFASALARVEGPSVRAWAASERNRSTWIKIASLYLDKPDAESLLTADIVGAAIGLF